MTDPTAYLIFWLPAGLDYETPGSAATDTAYENLIQGFFTNVAPSSYFQILAQYSGNNGAPPDSQTKQRLHQRQ